MKKIEKENRKENRCEHLCIPKILKKQRIFNRKNKEKGKRSICMNFLVTFYEPLFDCIQGFFTHTT